MSMTFMTWLGFAAMVIIALSFTWRPAYATLRPPRHRPVAFLFGGLFFIVLAFAAAWMAATAIDTGQVHLSHHRYGTLDAMRDIEPIAYWSIVVVEYSLGLMSASYSIASIALMDR
ncbi:hypothetical protein D3C81_588090 [compost metagenome]